MGHLKGTYLCISLVCQHSNNLGKKVWVCGCTDEWLYMCELFVYTDAERGRIKNDHRESDEEERDKRGDRPVCVLVGGNWGDHLPPLAPPWPQPEASGGPWVPEEKHLGPHHPWTQRWAVYLGLAAWQLYWCYIQAHRDPESEREREQERGEKGGRRRRRDEEWRSEDDGGQATGGRKGGRTAQTEVKRSK